MSILTDNICEFIILASMLIVLNSYMLRKYYLTLLDPGYLAIITLSIIIVDVYLVYDNSFMSNEEFCKNVVLILIYLVFISSLGRMFSKYRIIRYIQEYIMAPETKEEKLSYWIMYGMNLAATLYFSYFMIGASMGDERIVLAANNRVVDIIKNGSSMISFMSVILWVKTRNIKYLFALIIIAVINMVGGSKGTILSCFILYIVYRFIIEKPLSKLAILVCSICGFAGMMIVLLLFSNDINTAFYTAFIRVGFPGDAYLFAYVTGDYFTINEEYNMVGYILHPFYRLIGERGYDYPLGVALNGMVNGDYDGYGPNALLPIVCMVLAEHDILLSITLIMALCFFSVIPIILIIRTKMNNRFMWLYITLSLYYNTLRMFTEVGLWEQKLISLTIVCILVKFLVEMRKYFLINR